MIKLFKSRNLAIFWLVVMSTACSKTEFEGCYFESAKKERLLFTIEKNLPLHILKFDGDETQIKLRKATWDELFEFVGETTEGSQSGEVLLPDDENQPVFIIETKKGDNYFGKTADSKYFAFASFLGGFPVYKGDCI